MSSRPRHTFLIVLATLSLCVVFFTGWPGCLLNRAEVATSLVSTFFLFPKSHIRNVFVDEARAHVAAPQVDSAVAATLPIPAIIHQVQLGGLVMKPTWTRARQSCLDLHPHWDFKLWRDDDGNAFVQEHYPELYSTYRGYPLEIQRSNVLRYLVLEQYGGMYLDLDLRCRVPLDSLRNETFLTPPANPTGVNNAFIAAKPHHPFWSKHLIPQLKRYDLDWFGSPYITNMMSTGCHFFSTMHRTFSGQAEMGILDASNKLNGHVTTPLFEHLGASSWHKGDAKAILRLGKAVEAAKAQPVMAAGATLASLAAVLVFFALSILLLRRGMALTRSWRRRGTYDDLETSKMLVECHER